MVVNQNNNKGSNSDILSGLILSTNSSTGFNLKYEDANNEVHSVSGSSLPITLEDVKMPFVVFCNDKRKSVEITNLPEGYTSYSTSLNSFDPYYPYSCTLNFFFSSKIVSY